jgi:hypothetical protein
MQSEWGRPVAGARAEGIYRQGARLCALVLSLAASACANLGQIGNLTDGPKATVAFESLEGAPPDVSRKFTTVLRDEAGSRQMAVVTPGEATYRLRGYLTAQAEGGTTAIVWAWDVYDGTSQRRAFRLNGAEKANGAGWAVADDEVLRRAARAGMSQLAVFAAARPSTAASAQPEPPAPAKRSAMLGWIDDWAPESAGIFRIFKREPKAPEIVESGIALPPLAEVPMPQRRPAPSQAPDQALAFAPE